MRLEHLHKLTTVASYVFEEMTDDKTETELAREFWKYLRTKMLDDMTRKIRVSEFAADYIRRLPAAKFEKKYGVKLSNVKKSRAEMEFVSGCVSMFLHHSSYGSKIIDWS